MRSIENWIWLPMLICVGGFGWLLVSPEWQVWEVYGLLTLGTILMVVGAFSWIFAPSSREAEETDR